MRKDDWITELYYKQLSEKFRNNRDSRNTVPSKKEIPPTQDQFRCKRRNKNTKTILPL